MGTQVHGAVNYGIDRIYHPYKSSLHGNDLRRYRK